MRKTVLPASLCLAALLAAGEARAQAKKDAPAAPAASKSEEASARFKSGVAFYKDHDFTAAMVEFKRAYELLPNYNVLYNIGQTARELKDYATALNAFEQYLREGDAKVSGARKKEVVSAIDELRKKVGTLKITVNVQGADVLVDDVSVGAAPLANPVVVNVGRRKISATSSGFTPAQKNVEIAGDAPAEVSLELVKVGAGTAPPPPPPAPRIPLVAWVTLGATGAAAIVTAVSGGLAVSAHGTLKSELAKFPGDPKAIASAQSKTRAFAVTTDVFGAISVAGAAASGVLIGLALKPPGKRDSAAPVVSVSPMGVAISGVF